MEPVTWKWNLRCDGVQDIKMKLCIINDKRRVFYRKLPLDMKKEICEAKIIYIYFTRTSTPLPPHTRHIIITISHVYIYNIYIHK